MMNSELPALIAFGALLAIALVGLIKSNAAAERLNGSESAKFDATGQRDEPSRLSGTR